MSGPQIRVVIADDHPVFRRGLRGVLEEADDVEVVGEASDGAEAIELAVATSATVVLMDLAMSGMGGVEATAELSNAPHRPSVLVLTMSTDTGSVQAALRAGAAGYLVKGASGDTILAAVRAVAAGSAVLGPGVGRDLIAHPGYRARAHRPFPALTERELEVLDMVARGWSNPQIAGSLVVSDKTVRNHISNVLAKLDLPGRAQAIVLARQHGLGED